VKAVTLILASAFAAGATAYDGSPTPDEIRYFETEVRPLLAAKCQKCHGPRQQRGGLRLDSRAAVLKGGLTGPAVVPGSPQESLLIDAIHYESLEMPPDGKLSDREIATLTGWVKRGAPWPPVEATEKAGRITKEDRDYWAFQAIGDPPVPEVQDEGWSRNPIDRFLAATLAAGGLRPAPEADRRTLIRRATYDLIGLPPTPDEIEAFLADRSPAAYEVLIDRLLASPRHGERWGRHWLDLVRYAESDGHGSDHYRPEAWRYRDYVIRSFNDDKPYDRFVREQLAGDEIGPEDPDALTATGYLRHWVYESNQREIREVREIILNDVTDITAEVFLGLGFGCARCHDHKFDPILREDYYRLQAFFAAIVPRDDVVTASTSEWERFRDEQVRWERVTADVRGKLELLERPVRERLRAREYQLMPEELKEIDRKPLEQSTPLERQLKALIDRLKANAARGLEGEFTKRPEEMKRWMALHDELAGYDDLRPTPLAAPMGVTDVGPTAPTTVIPGGRTAIEPGLPIVLGAPPPRIARPALAPGSTGRRTALAGWIASAENPLTARVIVNRVWQYHFGTGLVATANDFGRLGETPSHPELLDWLAVRFIRDGWSFKKLHRLIMTSSAYRQAARAGDPGEARRRDPANRWLWRMNLRRLDADQLRDTMLAITGELRPVPGGPSVEAAVPRRTVYARLLRNRPEPFLQAFDVPDGFASTPKRDETTTANQALSLLNNPWTLERARALAGCLRDECPGPVDAGRIARAYRLVLGRPPDLFEADTAERFLRTRPDRGEALIDLCHVLLISDEVLYLD
jgi:hypothetical protein